MCSVPSCQSSAGGLVTSAEIMESTSSRSVEALGRPVFFYIVHYP